MLSDWQRVEELLLDTLRDTPEVALWAHSYLWQIYWLQGRQEDAKKIAEWLVEAPTYPGFPGQLALVYRGILAEMEGDNEKGLDAFEKAYDKTSTPIQWTQFIAYQPHEYSTWLGRAYLREGRLSEAAEKLNETTD